MSKKQIFFRRTSRRQPASGRKPTKRLSERDLAMSAEELQVFQEQFERLLARQEQRNWFRLYQCGQLSKLERKTTEAMVLELLGADESVIRTAQHFIGQAAWDGKPLLGQAQRLVGEWLGEPDGVVIVDGSGFPKQGSHSVGVIRQYCGHVGKVTNCQEGVFVLYASRRGYAFLDQRLYLPGVWFTPAYRERRRICGIPDTQTFQTEPELGLEMLTQVAQGGLIPFRWVTCDARYGEIPAFLDGIAALDKWFFAEVAADTQVWLRTPPVEPPGQGPLGAPRTKPRVSLSAPHPYEMRELLTLIPRTQWRRKTIKEGSKGPLVAEFAFLRVTPIRDQLPGRRCWVILRRTLEDHPQVKFFLSNAPTTCPLQEFVRVSGLRWPIETGLKESKGAIGMDHYETRTWLGWQHHMTLSILAHLFLVRLQLLLQKKSRLDYCSSPSADRTGDRRQAHTTPRYAGNYRISSTPKSCRLLFTPQTHTFSTCSASQTQKNVGAIYFS